jgi:hypothetical protein
MCLFVYGCDSSPKNEIPVLSKELELKNEMALVADSIEGLQLQTIVVLPCANGYDYATANMDLESEIVAALNHCNFSEAHLLSLKDVQGVNVYGLWHEKDLGQIRSKITEDFFVVCRMNEPFHEELARSESKKWGYHLKVYERKTGKLRGEIMGNELIGFESIQEDLSSHCEDFLLLLKAD